MLRNVTQGREIVIDPLTGNSYYQSTYTTLSQTKSIFNVTPIQDRCNPEGRITLDSDRNLTGKSSLNLETNSFISQPLITNAKCCKFWSEDSLVFSKSDIKSAVFINQIDRKFLCCIMSVENKRILVLFDQHAVHERIRLENLITEASFENSISNSELQVLQSKACHGAIKFGDKLDENVSIKLLSSLTECCLPFQCAHGRPSIAPLLNISSSKLHSTPYSFNCNKLRRLYSDCVQNK